MLYVAAAAAAAAALPLLLLPPPPPAAAAPAAAAADAAAAAVLLLPLACCCLLLLTMSLPSRLLLHSNQSLPLRTVGAAAPHGVAVHPPGTNQSNQIFGTIPCRKNCSAEMPS